MFYTINKNNQFVTNHPILKNISENLELGILQDYFKNIKPDLKCDRIMNIFLLFFFTLSICCSNIDQELLADFKSRDEFGITKLYKLSATSVFNVLYLDMLRLMEIDLYLASGVNVNTQNHDKKRQTPIFGAIKFKNNRIAEFLLSQGADPRLKNSDGESAIELAQKMLTENPSDKAILEICNTLIPYKG